MFVTQPNRNFICDRTIYVQDTRHARRMTDDIHIYAMSIRLLRGSTEEFRPLNRGFAVHANGVRTIQFC
jgi:hypothetical protein